MFFWVCSREMLIKYINCYAWLLDSCLRGNQHIMGKSQKYEQIINKHTTEMKLGQMDDQEAFIK